MIIKSTGCDTGFFSNIRPVEGKSPARGDSARANRAGAETFDSVLRGRTDTIEISGQRGNGGHSVPRETGGKILEDIERPADSGRLARLKKQISSGDYTVDPDELARILSE